MIGKLILKFNPQEKNNKPKKKNDLLTNFKV